MLPLFSPVSHQRLPWLQEQTLPLESSSFLGCSPILDRHNGNQHYMALLMLTRNVYLSNTQFSMGRVFTHNLRSVRKPDGEMHGFWQSGWSLHWGDKSLLRSRQPHPWTLAPRAIIKRFVWQWNLPVRYTHVLHREHGWRQAESRLTWLEDQQAPWRSMLEREQEGIEEHHHWDEARVFCKSLQQPTTKEMPSERHG